LNPQLFKLYLSQSLFVIFGQALPIILSPILTKYYDQIAFAQLTTFLSIVNILVAYGTLKLESSLILEENNDAIGKLLSTNLVLCTIILIINCLFAVLYKEYIMSYLNIKINIAYILIGGYCISVSLVFNSYLIKLELFKLRSLGKIIESIAYVFIALFAAYVHKNDNLFSLAYSRFVALTIMVLFLFYFVRRTGYIFYLNYREFYHFIIKYKGLIIQYLPSILLDALTAQLLIISLNKFCTPFEVGCFGLANILVLMPSVFIAQTFQDIYFQKLRLYVINKEFKSFKKLSQSTLLLISVISISLCVFAFLFIDKLVDIFYGRDWALTALIIKHMLLLFLFRVIIGTFSVILIAFNKLGIVFYWHLIRFVVVLLVFKYFSYFLNLSVIKIIDSYILIEVFFYLIYLIFILHNIKSWRLRLG
jgi:O-antigen/teichoic acid export membrane protein